MIQNLHGVLIPLDVIKKDYVLYSMSTSEIAKKHYVTESEVLDMVSAGSWESERMAIINGAKDEVGGDSGDVFKDAEILGTKAIEALNIIMRSELTRFYRHVKYYGDPFLRDPSTDEIMKDSYGNPVMLKVNNIPKKMEAKSIEDASKLSKKKGPKNYSKSKKFEFESSGEGEE